jgi:hypothetical protein
MAGGEKSAFARLNKALPAILPAPVLNHALQLAHSGNAAAGGGFILAGRNRFVGARLGGSQRRPGWLGVASRRRRAFVRGSPPAAY